jgi:hypothetical protein
MSEQEKLEVRFVGAYVLYKKLLQSYSSLGPEEKTQLITFVSQMLQQVSNEGQRLMIGICSRSFTALGLLQATTGDKPFIIEEIFSQLGVSNSDQSSTLLLHLLNSLAEELSSLIIERHKLLTLLDIFRRAKQQVADFIQSYLKRPNNTPESINLVLECITNWTSNQINFISCPKLVQTLISIYPNELYYETINEIFVRMLEAYSTDIQFNTKPLQEIIKTFECSNEIVEKISNEKEIHSTEESALAYSSLKLLLDFQLTIVGPKFEQEVTKRVTIVGKCFTEIFVQIVKSFPVILYLGDSAAGRIVYKYGMLLLMHCDNSISAHSLDIWSTLHRTINKQQKHLTPALEEFFLEVFDGVYKQLLTRCMISSNTDFNILTSVSANGGRRFGSTVAEEEDEESGAEGGLFKFGKTPLPDYRFKAQTVFAE